MSAAMHTPEPWYHVNGTDIHDRETRFDADGARIGSTANLIASALSMPDRAAAAANAARIVACVNACAGMADPAVEIAALKADNATLTAAANAEATECEALRSQRDELLAALKNLYALVQGECPSLLENDHHDDMVRAAIAKVQP